MTTLVRNTNYWEKNPIGPGQSDQLPYIEKLKFIVMPDLSTRQAAMRAGNVDQMAGFNMEDKKDMLARNPSLMVAKIGSGYILPAYMRVDKPPFDDVRVRRAVMMAIDMKAINDSLYSGLGSYPSWPYYYTPAYADLYLGLDDPMCPDTVKELFTYNPDKAKELLREAGYPNGFKTSVTLTNVEADYYAVIKDMLSKVNIELSLVILADMSQIMSTASARNYEMMVPGVSPPATYPEQFQYTGESYINGSILKDPYVNEMAEKARLAALTDVRAAMKITKELQPYLQDLALVIQTPRYPTYNIWWPWIKNYAGELSVGYFTGPSWIKYVWIDQDLKKSMGY
jgi:peptide/nickel transport system substrate-binding protein